MQNNIKAVPVSTHYSRAILWCNVLMSCMIVFLHTKVPELDLYPADVRNRWSIITRIISTAADSATPCFFTISAYLLFRKFIPQQYVQTVKSRTRSILIPYFLWSILGILYQNILHAFRGEAYENFLQAFLLASCDPPIWFLRTLFLYVLFTPIIFKLLTLSRYTIVLIPLLVVLNLMADFSYSSVPFWSPVYLFGAWLAIYHRDAIESSQSPRWFLDRKSVRLCVITGLLIYGTLTYQNLKLYYLYRMIISPATLYYFWKHPWRQAPHPMLQNTFFTFCSHALLLGAVPKIVFLFLPQSFPAICAGYLLSAGTVWLITLVTAQVMKTWLPPLYRLLNGGRKVH